jgi:hypothetical protein
MRLSKTNCIGGIALSMLCLSVTNAAPPFYDQIPNFTPYDIGAAPNGYILQGTLAAQGISGNGYMVVDPQNQRIAFRFENAGLGSFVTLPEGTYNFNLPGTGGACFLYPGFDYAKFKERFAALTSTPGSTTLSARFTGYVYDSTSCNQPATATFIQQPMGIPPNQTPGIAEMEFAIPTPAGNSVCRQGQAYWTANPTTIDTTSGKAVRDQAFVLPASCSNPINWCNAVYYNPNNQGCAIMHSTPLPL